MSSTELLGFHEQRFLLALLELEAEHGPAWFFVHSVIRTVLPPSQSPAGRRSPYRLCADAERVHPSRTIRRLAERGLVERNRMLGIGSSLRLTDAGRRLAAALAMPAATAVEESESVAA